MLIRRGRQLDIGVSDIAKLCELLDLRAGAFLVKMTVWSDILAAWMLKGTIWSFERATGEGRRTAREEALVTDLRTENMRCSGEVTRGRGREGSELSIVWFNWRRGS